MRLTDISLNWLLPGGVLTAGVLTATVVLARGRRARDRAAAEGSRERGEERRRRKETVYGSAAYVLLFCCAAVAAALSFHGLVGFGRQNLGLGGGWEYLAPFGLDGAAMFCSVLAVREASHGDAALGSRLLVWTFAGAAAWFNWVHAPRGLGHAGAPQFFAGMSLSAAVLFDRALKQTRRAALREQGLIPRPLPQIRMVRWLRAPRETFAAWSLMLLEGVRTLDEAVEEVREDRRERRQSRVRSREQAKRERVRLKELDRRQRALGRGGRQVDMAGLDVTTGAAPPAPTASPTATTPASAPAGAESAPSAVTEPAIADPGHLPVRPRPSLRSVKDGPAEQRSAAARPNEAQPRHTHPSGPSAEDLTAEDDTQTLPRLDSLERKLAEMEQQFG